jgi:hypothetical protein
MRVVHIAPGPTPTFAMSAPAAAFCGHDVAGDDGQPELEGTHLGDRPKHPLLVAVRRVDHEHVDARRRERLRLRDDVAVDPDGRSHPQPT